MDVGMTGEGQEKKEGSSANLMQEIRERASESVSIWSEIYDQAEKDVRFGVKGDQWPDDVKALRQDPEAPRVMLTINQLPKFIRQVIGDGKQNRLSIKVSPVEGNRPGAKVPNLAGQRDYTYAQIMEGLIRNIEYTSKAERAYDMALEHAVNGGFGWLRVIKRYARPDGFEQELAIRGVRNRWSILMDPTAMLSDEPDMADANYGIVHTLVPKSEARRRWGSTLRDASQITQAAEAAQVQWWVQEDALRLVEYYWVEEEKEKYVLLSDNSVFTEEDYLEGKQQFDKLGLKVVDSRTGRKRCVYWTLTDGHEPLEGPFEWDGSYIPIVPVLGPECLVNGKIEYQSLIRHSHDAQRLYNYWRTAATEAVALAPKAPWLADAQSVAGYEQDYIESMIKPKVMLKYRFREGVPAPTRVQSAFNPAAEISQALSANDDIKGTMGLFDASIGARSNETSGVAIEARQREGDVGTFGWHDSLAKAVEHVGRILCELIPKVIDTPRQVRLRLPDDTEDWVEINKSIVTPEGKELIVDLSAQRYDIAVQAGPSFTTQRKAAAASMVDFIRAVPNSGAVTGDLVAEAMDWPQADKFARRLRKTVPPQLLEPSELEALNSGGQDPNAPKQPTPEELLAAKELELKNKELELKDKELAVKELEIAAKAAQVTALQPENVKELIAEALASLMAVRDQPEGPPPAA